MKRGTHAHRPNRFVMPRRRGAVAGPLIMVVAAWGALIPFFGHSFGFGYTPSNTWTWTSARGYLEVLPGIGAFLGGALLTISANRATAAFGGYIAAASGGWFVLGTVISPWWSAGNIGTPVGSTNQAVWERIGMFTGVGMVLIYLAALSLGRISLSGYRGAPATSPEQLEALERIEGARTLPGERPRTVDLTAAEAGTDTTSESIKR